MSANEISFVKSGPDRWMARNGNYVINKLAPRTFTLLDGYGKQVNCLQSLAEAKRFAYRHQNGEA